jgi:hypothetical protein
MNRAPTDTENAIRQAIRQAHGPEHCRMGSEESPHFGACFMFILYALCSMRLAPFALNLRYQYRFPEDEIYRPLGDNSQTWVTFLQVCHLPQVVGGPHNHGGHIPFPYWDTV